MTAGTRAGSRRRAGWVLAGYALAAAALYYGVGVHEEPHDVKQVVRFLLGLPVVLIVAWGLGALGRTLAVLGSVGLTLVLVELCLPLVHAGSAHQQGIRHLMRYDARLGWAFAPGETAVVEDADYTTLVSTSAAGFRDREHASDDTRPVLTVLGDSFTSNVGVALEDCFTTLLDEALPGVSVRNRGVNGYGQVQELLLLEDLLEREPPDEVLVVLYVRNDFDDNLGVLDAWREYERPRAEPDGAGGLRLVLDLTPPAPLQPLERLEELVSGSAVLGLVRGGLRGLRGPRALRLDEEPPEWRYCRAELEEREREALEVTRLLIRRMAAACRAAGAGFGVVVAPTVWQVHAGRWSELVARSGLAPEAFDVGRPQAEVAAWCADLDLPCLDLLPALRGHAARGEELYYAREHHWNARGNRRVAEALQAWIEGSPD